MRRNYVVGTIRTDRRRAAETTGTDRNSLQTCNWKSDRIFYTGPQERWPREGGGLYKATRIR
jgi:hypothetical protein